MGSLEDCVLGVGAAVHCSESSLCKEHLVVSGCFQMAVDDCGHVLAKLKKCLLCVARLARCGWAR